MTRRTQTRTVQRSIAIDNAPRPFDGERGICSDSGVILAKAEVRVHVRPSLAGSDPVSLSISFSPALPVSLSLLPSFSRSRSTHKDVARGPCVWYLRFVPVRSRLDAPFHLAKQRSRIPPNDSFLLFLSRRRVASDGVCAFRERKMRSSAAGCPCANTTCSIRRNRYAPVGRTELSPPRAGLI